MCCYALGYPAQCHMYQFLLFCFVVLISCVLFDIVGHNLVHFSHGVYSIIQGSFDHSPKTRLLCKAIYRVSAVCRCNAELKCHLILFEVHIL